MICTYFESIIDVFGELASTIHKRVDSDFTITINKAYLITLFIDILVGRHFIFVVSCS